MLLVEAPATLSRPLFLEVVVQREPVERGRLSRQHVFHLLKVLLTDLKDVSVALCDSRVAPGCRRNFIKAFFAQSITAFKVAYDTELVTLAEESFEGNLAHYNYIGSLLSIVTLFVKHLAIPYLQQ